jgi:hypothetical protein
MNRLLVPLALAMLALGGLATAGGASDPRRTEPGASTVAGDRAAIQEALRAGIREATDGSAARTCDYITPEGRAWAIAGYGFRHKRTFRSCAAMVRFARRVEAPYLDDARRSTIRRIRFSGRVALAVVEGPRTRLPGDKRGYGGLVGVYLTKVGGRWKAMDADFVPHPFSSGR